MKKRKILYISGTRADYGLMRTTLNTIGQHPGLKLDLAVTGMHLMPKFGSTVKEIKKDGFKVHEIRVLYEKDCKESMAIFIGKAIELLTKKIRAIDPDIVLVLGDRGEALAGAIVGSYLSIPVAHIHGGEKSLTVDEMSRHAITKLAHLHFAAIKRSASRLLKMGEDKYRIFISGAPGLDDIRSNDFISKGEIIKKYKLDPCKPIILAVQHPVTTEAQDAAYQIRETIKALKDLKMQSIIIYPNADAGGREMIKVIEQYKSSPLVRFYKNITRSEYLGLMNVASVIIGNSSSGIIEAPLFHLPAVDIGTRQRGRDKAENIIYSGYNKKEIKKAIEKAVFDEKFRNKIKRCKNIYGGVNSAEIIANTLAEIKIDQSLLNKQITY